MFDFVLFEKFLWVHWSVLLLIFGFVITILLIEGFVHVVGWMVFVWLVGGYLFWMLIEYWLHWIVFYFESEKGIGARFHWIIYGVYYDYLNDLLWLVMSLVLSVLLVVLFVYVFYLVIGSLGFLSFGVVFLVGYLFYDMLHYYVYYYCLKSVFGKWLWELHMCYHFQNHERGYGVSVSFWDHVFGTAPKVVRFEW